MPTSASTSVISDKTSMAWHPFLDNPTTLIQLSRSASLSDQLTGGGPPPSPELAGRIAGPPFGEAQG